MGRANNRNFAPKYPAAPQNTSRFQNCLRPHCEIQYLRHMSWTVVTTETSPFSLCRRCCVVLSSVFASLLLSVLAVDNDTDADSGFELEPMVIPGGWHPGSECTCYNSTETERVHQLEPEPECRCRGLAFTDIPTNISSYMRRL